MIEANQQHSKTQREKMRQEELNQKVAEPLKIAEKQVKELLKQKEAHTEIKDALEECQEKVKECNSGIGDMEWEYEVK